MVCVNLAIFVWLRNNGNHITNLLLPFCVNFYADEKTSSAIILPETKSYYYFVHINCPLREPFLDVEVPGTIYGLSPKGCIDRELFDLWFLSKG